MKALPSKSWNRGLSWCSFAVSLLSMFACLCGAAFHLARAYIRTSVSTFPDEWPSFWAALFSFSFSFFSLVVCYSEVKRLSMKTVIISWWSRVVIFVFIILIFIMTFLSLISYILIEDIQTTLWVLMGFTPAAVLMAQEIDIIKRSYKMTKSSQFADYVLTTSDSSWGNLPPSPYSDYESSASATESQIQPRALSPLGPDVDYSLSTPSISMPTKPEIKNVLKGITYALGILVMVFISAAYLMFTITSLVHASMYSIMLNPPGVKYDVPFSNTSERTIKLHINCLGNHSAEYPYTLVLDHDQSIPSPSMFLVQDYIRRKIGLEYLDKTATTNFGESTTMRICTYDRGGYGWSERGRNIVLESEKAQQLIALLRAAGERGPYIFGAHGHGGLIMAETINQLKKDSVAGIILIDSYVFGNIRKRIVHALGKSYKKDVKKIIDTADRNRASSPLGASWIKGSKKAAAIDSYIQLSLKINYSPTIYVKDAIKWSMSISSGLDSAYWDILEYYMEDAVSNEVIRK